MVGPLRIASISYWILYARSQTTRLNKCVGDDLRLRKHTHSSSIDGGGVLLICRCLGHRRNHEAVRRGAGMVRRGVDRGRSYAVRVLGSLVRAGCASLTYLGLTRCA